jgi:hypothetical protein
LQKLIDKTCFHLSINTKILFSNMFLICCYK